MPRTKITPPFGVTPLEVAKRRMMRWYEIMYEAKAKYDAEIEANPHIYGTYKERKHVPNPSIQRQRRR